MFGDTLAALGMGQVLDFVPNHMGVGQSDNAWWLDVLEWGADWPYAECFDVDWQPAQAALRVKVLLPFLGDHYGRILEDGAPRLALEGEDGTLSVWYFEHRFPLTPASYAPVLARAVPHLASDTAATPETIADLELLVAGFRDFKGSARSGRHRATRRAKADRLKANLAELIRRVPVVLECIRIGLAELNGTPGKPKSSRALHGLLEQQSYRLAFWRVAAEEINYRRFFQVNDLAGIRVEVSEVFDAVHRPVLGLIAGGRVHGLRIDHIDGLFDPQRYLEHLQSKIAQWTGRSPGASNSGSDTDPPFWIFVEKILAHHERLREDWPVAGTPSARTAAPRTTIAVSSARITASWPFVPLALLFPSESSRKKAAPTCRRL